MLTYILHAFENKLYFGKLKKYTEGVALFYMCVSLFTVWLIGDNCIVMPQFVGKSQFLQHLENSTVHLWKNESKK